MSRDVKPEHRALSAGALAHPQRELEQRARDLLRLRARLPLGWRQSRR